MGQAKLRLINQILAGLPKPFICRKNGMDADQLEAFIKRHASILVRRTMERNL